MQETWVQSLMGEDLTCPGATEPVHHNYLSLCSIAQELQLLSPRVAITEATFLEPVLSNKSHYNEKFTTIIESPYGQINKLI